MILLKIPNEKFAKNNDPENQPEKIIAALFGSWCG